MVPGCSGHARRRSQTGRPSCRTTEVGLEAPQLSPRTDVENPLSEWLDPAFAVRACRIPENTSLALTLQIKDHFSDLRDSWSQSESIRPWEHTAPLLAARVTRVSPVTASLLFIQAYVFLFQAAHRKGLVSSSISAGTQLEIVASGRFSASTESASASPCFLVS